MVEMIEMIGMTMIGVIVVVVVMMMIMMKVEEVAPAKEVISVMTGEMANADVEKTAVSHTTADRKSVV